jgi:peptide methionine sulfoxide reductase MsrB
MPEHEPPFRLLDPSTWVSRPTWLRAFDKEDEPLHFYDSNTGELLFTAALGRSFSSWVGESLAHGWPSFRDAEVNWEHVRCLQNGECVSLAGTHLGHNLPDMSGNRYCINLVSIAGRPDAPPPPVGSALQQRLSALVAGQSAVVVARPVAAAGAEAMAVAAPATAVNSPAPQPPSPPPSPPATNPTPRRDLVATPLDGAHGFGAAVEADLSQLSAADLTQLAALLSQHLVQLHT